MAFKDIRGQDLAIKLLTGYMKQGKLTGSYLFIGPEGIGKKITALTVAKALNCQVNKFDSCDKCASCLKIDKNGHPDVHLIESQASEAIKIEYVRQMRNAVNLKPYEAKKKVFIIDDAHNLTQEAANSLLKVLEEPGPNNVIILVTAVPSLLPKTAISRCKLIKFSALGRVELENFLKDDFSLPKDKAHFLAYYSQGRIGSALALKDSTLLKDKNRVIDEFIFQRQSTGAANFLSEPNKAMSMETRNRVNLRNQLNILASWFRDIYFIKIGLPHSELINYDCREKLLKEMAKYSFFELDEILKFISDSLSYIEQNVNVKLLVSNLKSELWKKGF
ncbi:MAG: hypothetical protein DRP74_02470 [Candidatus Omnitrophota bacterium]|nr:MAG: hypothetical protein DRP74_02470 [Candidatus Omnitrophota bacterium]